MPFTFAKTILDVRREPLKATQSLVEDPLQETQLLPGEEVAVLDEKGDWAYIESMEQPCWRNGWAGYKGWVERIGLVQRDTKPTILIAKHGAERLSIGSKIFEAYAIDKSACRDPKDKINDERGFVITMASSFLGMPYQWGGRSSYLPGYYPISSVDCSGLVNLCFLMMGRIVPRDAHDQWLKAKPIEPKDLKPGDLIFTAKATKPERMTHVMIYKGNNTLIEAASAAGKVQEILVTEKLGCSLEAIKNGAVLPDKVIFTGSFL